MRTLPRLLASIGAAVALCGEISAGWEVVYLHPFEGGGAHSVAYDVRHGQQVGSVASTGYGAAAAMWSGSAQSWRTLAPPGASISVAYATDGLLQGGYATFQMTGRAPALWHGAPATWQNLHSTMVKQSGVIYAMTDRYRVGYFRPRISPEACIWDAAGALRSLHSRSFSSSTAFGVDEHHQVGVAHIAYGPTHAVMWTGSAESWVDLHPFGYGTSEARAVDGGQQVGYVVPKGLPRASLWTGTAESWVDLTPEGFTSSAANDVHRGVQVGYSNRSDSPRAGLWRGTPESWQDLHLLLPSYYTYSVAYGVWVDDDGRIFVVGTAHNGALRRGEAIMWVGEV